MSYIDSNRRAIDAASSGGDQFDLTLLHRRNQANDDPAEHSERPIDVGCEQPPALTFVTELR